MKIKKIALAILTIAIFCGNVIAQNSIDFDKLGKIEFEYVYNETAVTDVSVNVYKVADITQELNYELIENYKNSNVYLDETQDGKEWQTFANNLQNYKNINMLEADYSGKTDINGHYNIKNLPVGVYLVDIADTKIEGDDAISSPTLVVVPTYMESEEEMIYNLKISPKIEIIKNEVEEDEPKPPSDDDDDDDDNSPPSYNDDDDDDDDDNPPPSEDDDEEISYNVTVTKQWLNDENTNARPEYIEITIYFNGRIAEIVKLFDGNNWSYSIENITVDGVWAVFEQNIPLNYSVEYKNIVNDFTIINIYEEYEENEDEDDEYEEEYDERFELEHDDTIGDSSHNDYDTTVKLPQTGTNIWLSPVFAIAGILLLIAGIWVRKNEENSK